MRLTGVEWGGLMHLVLRLYVIVLLVLASATPSDAKKIALVIGNSEYRNLDEAQALRSPSHDAEAISNHLRALDFTIVEMGLDVDRKRFHSLWQDFLDRVEPGDVALFYFSGHGLESSGENFLIPSDIDRLPDGTPHRVRSFLGNQAVSFTGMLDEFNDRRQHFREQEQEDVYGIFIVDACREAPLPKRATKWAGVAQSGMAPVRHPAGTFILFAADAGQKALDRLDASDTDNRSVYTRKLLELMKPEHAILGLADMAQVLRISVYNEAARVQHTQTPAYYDGLLSRRTIRGEAPPPASAQVAQRLWQKHAPEALSGGRQVTALLSKSIRQARSLQEQRQSLSNAGDNTVNPTLLTCVDCPEMVVIAGKTFAMGPDGASREIELSHNFALGKFEVTYAQWQACTRSPNSPCRAIEPSLYQGDRLQDRDRRPMVGVSWDDAQAFILWLNRKHGIAADAPDRFRLPTEAEWEFAARAGTRTPYSFGDSAGHLCLYANGADERFTTWLGDSSKCDDEWGAQPAPVGSFKPNPLGLYDMHGNIWEWVGDCWVGDLHQLAINGPPQPSGPSANCARRTARGGSWASPPRALRSDARLSFAPGHARPTLGFRVARTLPVDE
jgi:formylglycine-generating enzyme required for sulfatase activity